MQKFKLNLLNLAYLILIAFFALTGNSTLNAQSLEVTDTDEFDLEFSNNVKKISIEFYFEFFGVID